ncbi:MAG: hypothetical protein ABIT38_17110 [Gemmatimonadaceae bacterium]
MRIPCRLTLVHVALVVMCACSATAIAPGNGYEGEGDRILFIGNSHTYVNDVPGLVQAFADSMKSKQIAVGSIVQPGFALIDHWLDPNARAAAARCEGVTHVVMQQGWTPEGVFRDTLVLATRNFAELVAKCGSRPVLYQIWPLRSRPQDFPGTIESYAIAARESHGVLAPVAQAWQLAISRAVAVELWSPDGLHASAAGSYLAAVVLYAQIFAATPIGLPASVQTRSGMVLRVDAPTARLLQQAAADAIAMGT